jgi:DNA replication protein DnaC
MDEVGYIPFETEAANLFFQLVSSRYEHASLILTSNLPFSGWGEVFGNHVVASAMIDRIVHHVRSHHPQRQQLPTQKHKHDTSQRKTREQGTITTTTVVHISLPKMVHF